ncbi:MAG: hypothetical protein NWS18_05950 [Schleiferiaceae bacterium]|jgi:uncharacterized membrane protein|nr:hypothetical protein [Schleiferiaceae bacterium]
MKSTPAMRILSVAIIASVGWFASTGCEHDPINPVDPNPTDTTSPCDPGTVDFKNEVLPLITGKCAMPGCHNSPNGEDGVVLDSYAKILREVSPGRPNNSELWESITETDPDKMMPPPGYPQLTPAEKELIRQWILQGAKETDCAGNVCDTAAAPSFAEANAIIQAQCVGCHAYPNVSGNVTLDSYLGIKNAVENNNLLGALKGVGSSQMPPSGAMNACNQRKIARWVAAGMPQ